MANANKIGIWMDHSNAHMIEYTTDPIETTTLASDFTHAVKEDTIKKSESLMIGDSLEADVYGALNFGMDAVYFNPFNAPKPDDVPVQIHHLKELMTIL